MEPKTLSGGGDCIYPAKDEGLVKRNNNVVLDADRKEVELDDVGSNGCDIIDIGEEVKEL